MKHFLPICFLLFCEAGIACSGFPNSFCYTHASRPNDLVVKGTITGTASHSIQFKILEILKGTENKPVITIWDGKDFDCNGAISMKVSDMGSVGDTLVAVLPMIQAVQNAWDVVGDYSRPYWLFYEPVLKIKNDTLKGLINGSTSTAPPYWSLNKMNYADFKAYWTAHQGDCSMLTGLTGHDEKHEPLIRQDGSTVYVSIPGAGSHTIRVVSLQGKIIAEQEASGEFIFNLEHYASGMYLICVLNTDGKQYRQKVLR